MNFFTIFYFEFSSSGWVGTEFGSFFLSFSAYLIPFWLKIMPEIGFLIFWFFSYFFRNFFSGFEYEQNSGLKLFSPFLTQSHPVLAKNNAGKKFFNFLNFFAIFFWNFLSGVEYERNSRLKFFSPLLGLSHPRFG